MTSPSRERSTSSSPRSQDPGNLRLIGALADQYRAMLHSALAGAREVALLDFPNYPNVGDSLIWLGQLAALRDLGVRVRYMATAESFSWRELDRRLPRNAPILFSGGGNLGDLYPRIQAFRWRVLNETTDRPFIQLPQSIHFASNHEAERFFELVRERPAVTLMVRDRESEALALAHGAAATLCPDAAFCLGPLTANPPTQSIVLLLRTDEEKASRYLSLLDGHDVESVDWIHFPDHWIYTKLYNATFVTHSRRMFPLVEPFLGFAYSVLPKIRLTEGIDMLTRGEVLVTDRLHGHVLATLLSIPHVLLDNSYGKLARFHRDWTSQLTNVCIPYEGESFGAVCERARIQAVART